MLKSLQLSNFQGHKQSALDFSDRVNVIVGSSNSGKSSIFRALFWLWSNRPLGTNFIRFGQKKTNLTLVWSEKGKDTVVTRSRSQAENCYTVGDQKYGTVGKDVPETLQQLLKWDKINIQRQLDPHFLLLDAPGEVAAVFNSYTKLDKADAVSTILSSQLRAKQAELDTTTSQRDEIEEQLVALLWLNDFEELVAISEELHEKIEQAQKQRTLLLTLSQAYTENEATRLSLTEDLIVKASKRDRLRLCLVKLGDLQNKYATVLHEQSKLTGYLVNMRATTSELECTAGVLQEKRKVLEQQKAIVSQGARFQELTVRMQQVERQRTVLVQRQSMIDEVSTALSRTRAAIAAAQQKYLLAKQELAKALETCPLCGQTIDEAARVRVLEGM